MSIKFKVKNGKEVLVARDEVQAAAFLKADFEPATKEDEAKLKKLNGQKEEE